VLPKWTKTTIAAHGASGSSSNKLVPLSPSDLEGGQVWGSNNIHGQKEAFVAEQIRSIFPLAAGISVSLI